MPKRQFTLDQQAKGYRAALRSERTPRQLRAGLRKRLEWVNRAEKEISRHRNQTGHGVLIRGSEAHCQKCAWKITA